MARIGIAAGARDERARGLRGAWAWGLAGLLVVAAAIALDPMPERRALEAAGGVDASPAVVEDWRGNSARLVPPAR